MPETPETKDFAVSFANFDRDALDRLTRSIQPVDALAAAAIQKTLDGKTKPRGSLGRLETLACQIGSIRRSAQPELGHKAIVVMAADHGVAVEGVSAYPQEVTVQMLLNFAGGGAAINVLARAAGARLLVVDMGVKDDNLLLDRSSAQTATASDGMLQVRRCPVGPGTGNLSRQAAMTPEQALCAIGVGASVAAELFNSGVGVVGLGEMGIGNTTSASAVTSVMTGNPVSRVTGHGTGVLAASFDNKVAVVERALRLHRQAGLVASDPLRVLSCVGGFEIAGLVGLVLGAAARGMVVVMDGFITGAAVLIATALAPESRRYIVASHRSVEPGHTAILAALELHPVLEMDLRLGEGTGAALTLPLLDAAILIRNEMASFASAGVTDSGAGTV